MPTSQDRTAVMIDKNSPAMRRVDRLARAWGVSRSHVVRILIHEALVARQHRGLESGARESVA